ncbi:MAG: acyl carrier protein [bacterium]|jgi:acyl carrier protein
MQPVDRTKLRHFITENFLFGRADDLSDHDSFLEKGIIDSTGILELIAFVEQQYGVKVEDEELVPQNLDSIDSLAAYIERKTGRAQAAA